MTLTTRTEMRRCGHRWPDLDAAQHSKKFLAGGQEAWEHPACAGVHLRPAGSGAKAAGAKSAGEPETFSASVCALIDQRDGDDTGAALVRLCQGCGKTRGLHRHHRRLRQDEGSTSRPHAHCCCNALTLCFDCHEWAHRNRREAEAMGWIVSQSVDEPGSVGVMRFAAAEGGATQWPTCSGEWAGTAPEAAEVAA